MSISSVPEVGGNRPHAYDPWSSPELFRDVRRKRMIANVLDALIILFFQLTALGPLFLIGLVTDGTGFALFPIIMIAIALGYFWLTLGKSGQSVGMRMVGIRLAKWTGELPGPLLAVGHPFLFYISVVSLSPLVLLVGLFNERKRLLHDLLLGTVVVADRPATAPQPTNSA
jgi:uncharacterized RDD family membrane protein YckC